MEKRKIDFETLQSDCKYYPGSMAAYDCSHKKSNSRFCVSFDCPRWASLDVPCEETSVGYESKNTDWEKCQKCGRRYSTVWNCNSDIIWEQITGKEYAGLYCPMCFDQMAQAKEIRLYWSCVTCEETPTPDEPEVCEEKKTIKGETK
jgi:ribosomal protein L34E